MLGSSPRAQPHDRRVQPPNAFRAAEKAFKAYRDARQVQPLPEFLDFERPHPAAPADAGGLAAQRPAAIATPVAVSELAPPWLRDAQIFSIDGVDGFRFIRSPLSAAAQLRLARSALREWVEPPAATNLALHDPSGAHDRLWERHQREPTGSLFSKLTWATVGYQYQWTERVYDPERRSPFPEELSRLSADLAAACGWRVRPEAAIVNLYGPSSAMGGHRDDAEPCQSVPIVSISIGLDAIYLLGRETKEHAPIAMRLRSGDVVVQGGASRGYVHGVPRVLADSLPAALAATSGRDAEGGDGAEADEEAAADLEAVRGWLSGHRLNINVRQCFDADEGRNGGEGAASEAEARREQKRRRVCDGETSLMDHDR